MKIWVLVIDNSYEYDNDISIELYQDCKKAREKFVSYVVDALENDHLVGKTATIIEEEENYFSIYKDGSYSEDHYTVYLEEKEVQ